jgi:hypothetical protein
LTPWPGRRLSTDFNCTVTDPAYVTDLLDRLRDEAPRLYGMILYVEEAVHPGLYRRRKGMLDLSSIHGPGFGYRLAEIRRELPPPAVECGT